jgi:hypothetical protein
MKPPVTLSKEEIAGLGLREINARLEEKYRKQDEEDGISVLEQASLDALYQYCPICSVKGTSNFCEECKLKWEPGMIYFRNPNPVLKWA